MNQEVIPQNPERSPLNPFRPTDTHLMVDGVGSTGKSSMEFLMYDFIREIYHSDRNLEILRNFKSTRAPLDNEVFQETGVLSPAETMRKYCPNKHPSTQIAAAMAYNRMVYTTRLNETHLFPELSSSPNLVMQGRGLVSAIAYNMAQTPEDPWAKQGGAFKIFTEGMPFPDILGIIIPDPEAQRKRLEKRVKKNHGKLEDRFDQPNLQENIIERYRAFLMATAEWKRIYEIQSAEVNPDIFKITGISGLTCLAVLTLALAIEKGFEPQIKDMRNLSPLNIQPAYLNRLKVNELLIAYLIPNYLTQLFSLLDPAIEGGYWRPSPNRNPKDKTKLDYTLENLMRGRLWGDVGCILDPQRMGLVFFATENRISMPPEEALHQVKKAIDAQDYTQLTSRTRYGPNPYRDPERKWHKIPIIEPEYN